MSDRDLFLEFQKEWSLDKVKNMTLDEYTNVKERNPNYFTYWMEFKLKDFGGFASYGATHGPASMGLFTTRDGNVLFNKNLGDSKEQVFKIIKADIIKVIEYSMANELEKIDDIDTLWVTFKWKIAFHYQNIDDMRILSIFKPRILKAIAKGEFDDENMPISQLYKRILGDKTHNLENIENITEKLWNKYAKNDEDSNNFDIPLNQILYGPPGTGKTYHTIDKALEILGVDTNGKSRAELKKIFDEYKNKGQIEFVTFHQSFSYEEFVEGIKPNLDSNKNSESIRYFWIN